MFEKNAVQAASVEDFLNRYYKRSRFHRRGTEYADAVIASHKYAFEVHGYTIISRHESTTGDVVAYFGPTEANAPADVPL